MTKILMSQRMCALLLACTACLAGTSSAAGVASPLAGLIGQVIERNAIGDQVALSKWDSGRPVLDAGREAAVLEQVRAQAPAHGLDPEQAARFFAAQIEANKLVQYQLLDGWRQQGGAPSGPRPDLALLRARLDRLQRDLLDSQADAAPLRARGDCPVVLARQLDSAAREHHLDALHRAALVRSFGDYCQP